MLRGVCMSLFICIFSFALIWRSVLTSDHSTITTFVLPYPRNIPAVLHDAREGVLVCSLPVGGAGNRCGAAARSIRRRCCDAVVLPRPRVPQVQASGEHDGHWCRAQAVPGRRASAASQSMSLPFMRSCIFPRTHHEHLRLCRQQGTTRQLHALSWDPGLPPTISHPHLTQHTRGTNIHAHIHSQVGVHHH